VRPPMLAAAPPRKRRECPRNRPIETWPASSTKMNEVEHV
jgi:hypothetical protein